MREFLSVSGGKSLKGRVSVSGAKNSALPLLFACLLSKERCVLHRVPDLEDISVTLRMLSCLGAQTSFKNGTVDIHAENITSSVAPYGLVKALRASFWVLGPLLARTGEAQVALPGGDAIGTRPVDLHLKGLVRMGADVRLNQGVVVAKTTGALRGANIDLDYPSVGATHHLMMTAALIPEDTVISGAAQEPEIQQLGEFLESMGARVEGAGTPRVRISGLESLGSGSVSVLGDRIEAATYLMAGAVTQGDVTVEGISPHCLGSTLEVLQNAGCEIETGGQCIRVSSSKRLKAVDFKTEPFPGVATDVQPLLLAALATAEGTSEVHESVFENRFGHVAEYRRLGANIEVEGRIARVRGVDSLSGAPVEAGDIRAAAGLVLMGLMAKGKTEIHEIFHLDRGYESLEEKFASLGADIKRFPVFEDSEVVFGC